MARFEAGPGIVTNGLVLNLDAGDPDSYTRSQPPYVEVLVVAGGGGGGAYAAGAGGGAGGVIYNSAYQLTSAAAVTVTVGAGGAGQVYTVSGQTNGNNSVFGSLTAIGGGYGGAGWGQNAGANGGSGGGGAGYDGNYPPNGPLVSGGTGTVGQGNNGGVGRGISGNRGAAGGGGGAGQVGGDSTTNSGGNGGNGLAFSISGTSTYYGGGGGGGDYGSANGGQGGLGGGGNVSGGNGSGIPGYPGTANTGGGGGGSRSATSDSWNGGNGGSGIVIVRYPGLPAATGGTITYLNGYTIHKFTSSGTFTPYLWNDLSGGGRNGTLVNGVGFIPNKNGGILVFDGSDDYISNINNSGMLSNGTGGFSYFAWVNLQGKPSLGTIFENGLYTSGILIRYESSVISIYSQGALYGTFSFNPTLDTWHHLGFIRDGNTLYFYQNGSTSQNMSFSPSISYSSNLFIGTSQHATYQCFNGYIPVAQIYNRTLSATEVTQNFNAQRARFGI